MLTIITDVPENVVGFYATEKVNESDYDNILIPAVNTMVEKYGKINFFLVLDGTHTKIDELRNMF